MQLVKYIFIYKCIALQRNKIASISNNGGVEYKGLWIMDWYAQINNPENRARAATKEFLGLQ